MPARPPCLLCFRETCTRGRARARSLARRRQEPAPYENLMKGYLPPNKGMGLDAAPATC